MPQVEQLAIVKSWLDRKGLQFIELHPHAEKDTCNTLEDLLEILTNQFRPQFNKTIKSLQFCKLSRQNGENAEEWMGRLWLSVIECNYKQLNRKLKEQFIHGLNDTDVLGKNNSGAHKNTWKYRDHQWKCVILGQKSWGTKSPMCHHEQPHWGKRLW